MQEPEARKIFGKKEIQIIKKQIRGIVLTQSEKNRLSRDIKKKFAFIQMANKTKINLVQGNRTKRKIDKTLKEILKQIKPKAVLLFGSYANNTQWIRSDIDICIVLDEILSITEATKLRLSILSNIPSGVDFWVFNNLPEHIKKTIADNHKVLMQSKIFDDDEFTVSVWKKYFDFKKEVATWT